MKRIFTILVAVLLTATLWAQSPEKMSYQAVIRNLSDQLVANQAVGIQISILQNSASGTVVYVETQTPTTNANGLVSIEIGTGTTSDDFSAIDWSVDTYFIKTETDPTGGSNYTITGVSQLLSVPYALHAKTAETVTGGITESQVTDLAHTVDTDTHIDSTGIANLGYVAGAIKSEVDGSTTNELQTLSISNDTIYLTNGGFVKIPVSSSTHYVGEVYGGGVVFYVDHTGEHGLIVSLDDISTSAPWGQDGSSTNATSTWNGAANSTTITTEATAGNAVLLAQAHNGGGNSDWYLPAIDELNVLYNTRIEVNKTLSTATGASEIGQNYYWSSTEYGNWIGTRYAWYYRFDNSYTGNNSGDNLYWVRAVRAF